jgi:hypothetical protein
MHQQDAAWMILDQVKARPGKSESVWKGTRRGFAVAVRCLTKTRANQPTVRPSSQSSHAFPRRHILHRLAPHKRRSSPQRGPFPRAQCVSPNFRIHTHPSPHTFPGFTVGWSTTVRSPNSVGFQQNYDQGAGYGNPAQDIGVKGRLINLISAVRTVMRSACHHHFHLRSGHRELTPTSTTYRNKRRSHHLRTHTRKIKIEYVKRKHILQPDSPAQFNPFNFLYTSSI